MLGKEQHGHALKIGLNLYVRMLNSAMHELEGVEDAPEREIPIDLPLEARIPEEYLPHDADRILLYQKLASIRDIEELHKKKAELEHANPLGSSVALHPGLNGLFDVLEIKLLAAHSSLLSIDTMYPTPENRLTSPRITLTSEKAFPDLPNTWEHVWSRNSTANKVRTTIAELGDQWVESLKDVIKKLQ